MLGPHEVRSSIALTSTPERNITRLRLTTATSSSSRDEREEEEKREGREGRDGMGKSISDVIYTKQVEVNMEKNSPPPSTRRSGRARAPSRKIQSQQQRDLEKEIAEEAKVVRKKKNARKGGKAKVRVEMTSQFEDAMQEFESNPEWSKSSGDQQKLHQSSVRLLAKEQRTSDTSLDSYITSPSSPSTIHTPIPRQTPPNTTDGPHYDPDIASEAARVQTSVSPSEGESRMQAVTKHLSTHLRFPALQAFRLSNDMRGYRHGQPFQHPNHRTGGGEGEGMTCRRPYGMPGGASACTPQNLAWISGIRRAQVDVFIQSPTMNAEALIPALLAPPSEAWEFVVT